MCIMITIKAFLFVKQLTFLSSYIFMLHIFCISSTSSITHNFMCSYSVDVSVSVLNNATPIYTSRLLGLQET